MKGLIFTYALTYGGAVVSLFNPFYGLLIYICFAIIKPESLWHWSVPAGNYSRIVAIALLVGWALHGFGGFRLGKAKSAAAWLTLFIVWAAISTLFCSNQSVGIGFLESKGKIVLPVIVGLTLIESRQQLKQLAWTITLSMGYVAFDLNMSYFDGFNRLQVDGFGGMDNNSMTIGLVTGVGLAFFLGLGETAWWKKLTAFGLAAFMTHAVFFSFSRGGMLGLCIVGMVSFFFLARTPKYYVWFAVGVILAGLMAGPEVRARFESAFAEKKERDWSAESRVELWTICLKMLADHPLLGVGPDHYPLQVHNYPTTSTIKAKFVRGKEAHTLWLQIAAELGIVGLLALAGFYCVTIFGLWQFLRSHRTQLHEDPFITFVPQMVCAALIGFAVSAQFVSLEGLEIPYYVALLGAGAIKIAGYEQQAAAAYATQHAMAAGHFRPAQTMRPQANY